ncbi:hypothetical protein LOK49_LG03G00739 [Camellia lanceoleosa]|uniref:Uncharacterized protein n=1 Tax=Camellia lanceoleosa TaxID=1840588 RepID=A0ACC0IC36_9ERIC|nr:hypothetical protein LOK49_LG03G00739 [Camellia lanceoleosa]
MSHLKPSFFRNKLTDSTIYRRQGRPMKNSSPKWLKLITKSHEKLNKMLFLPILDIAVK